MKDDDLFAAFVAGFQASGEGFNGEYVGARYRAENALEDHLRRWYFSAWLEDREVDYDTMIAEERADEAASPSS